MCSACGRLELQWLIKWRIAVQVIQKKRESRRSPPRFCSSQLELLGLSRGGSHSVEVMMAEATGISFPERCGREMTAGCLQAALTSRLGTNMVVTHSGA